MPPMLQVAELQEGLSSMMAADPPISQADVIAYVKGRKAEQVCATCCVLPWADSDHIVHGRWGGGRSFEGGLDVIIDL